MRKSIALVIWFSVNILFSYGQNTFEKIFSGLTIGGSGHICEQTSDSGFIIANPVWDAGHTRFAACLIKLNVDGDTLWTKTFIGGGNYSVKAVRQLSDGGYLIGGDTGIFIAGDYCIFLIRTDSLGNRAWTKTFGGGSAWTLFYDATETSDGGIAVIGSEQAFGAGSKDIFLIKTDANGDTLWTKTFGSVDSEEGKSISETPEEDLLIAGAYTVHGGLLLMKTDSAGNLLWAKTYGGSGGDFGHSVCVTNEGNYLVAGYTFSYGNVFPNVTWANVYLVKVNANGDTLWTRTYSTPGRGPSMGNSVMQTMDGGFIITGTETNDSASATHSDPYLIRIDSAGNILWSKKYGGTGFDYGNFAEEAIDGGFVLCGTTSGLGANSGTYFIKTDSTGNTYCNDSSIAFIAASPPTTVNNITVQIFSGGILGTPSMRDSSGSLVVTLCSSVNYESSGSSTHSEILIFPHPAHTAFTVSITSQLLILQLEIYNLLGEKIYSSVINNKQEIINCSNFPPGIYFVKLQSEKRFAVQKLIVE